MANPLAGRREQRAVHASAFLLTVAVVPSVFAAHTVRPSPSMRRRGLPVQAERGRSQCRRCRVWRHAARLLGAGPSVGILRLLHAVSGLLDCSLCVEMFLVPGNHCACPFVDTL